MPATYLDGMPISRQRPRLRLARADGTNVRIQGGISAWRDRDSRIRNATMGLSMTTACRATTAGVAAFLLLAATLSAQRYTGSDGTLRVALAQQPFSPNGTSPGPKTMANGGIQQQLAALGATVRIQEAALTADENTEYGGWKRLGMALGHFAEIVSANEIGRASW